MLLAVNFLTVMSSHTNPLPAAFVLHLLLTALLTTWSPVMPIAQAQYTPVIGPRDTSRSYVRLMFENDLLQLRPTDIRDHDFTNGVQVDLMGNFWGQLFTRHVLLEFPKEHGCSFDYLYSFSFGQERPTNSKHP